MLVDVFGVQFYALQNTKTLGCGQFGTVSTATEIATGEVVAVKCVPRSKVTEAHFLEEAEAHREAGSHPNVVGVKVRERANATCGLNMILDTNFCIRGDERQQASVSCPSMPGGYTAFMVTSGRRLPCMLAVVRVVDRDLGCFFGHTACALHKLLRGRQRLSK